MGQALCCLQVDQSTVAIKESFGKFDDVLQPGCHCLPWVFGQQVVGYLSLRVQQLDVRCETKTKDNVFVTVVASIQYRALAEKASDAFYKLSNTREQIQSYVFDVIRASVPKSNLDDVFEQKNDIAKAVEDELEKAMSTYGYEIVQTLIVDIEPDVHVKRAMNEINAGWTFDMLRSLHQSWACYSMQFEGHEQYQSSKSPLIADIVSIWFIQLPFNYVSNSILNQQSFRVSFTCPGFYVRNMEMNSTVVCMCRPFEVPKLNSWL